MFGKRRRQSRILTARQSQQRARRHVIESLEQRLLLTTDFIDASSTDDQLTALAGAQFFPNLPYTLREAVIVAHQSSADTVQIDLLADTTYDLTRHTNSIGPTLIFSEGTVDDPAYGDIDISRDLIINGNGATIDANEVGRIFQISGGVQVEFRNVTLVNGRAARTGPTSSEGGAIHIDNDSGAVTLTGSTLQFNEAPAGSSGGDGLTARGGAIYIEGGELTLDDTDLLDNSAVAGDGETDTPENDVNNGGSGGLAEGGGIYSELATISIVNGSKLERNRALSGDGGRGDDDGGNGRSAFGGGVYMDAGELTIQEARIVGNEAIGGDGGNGTTELGGQGGWGYGGAIYAETDVSSQTFLGAKLTIEDTLFNINRAIGGKGGDGDGQNDGPAGGDGGRAHGGGIYASDRVEVELTDSRLIFNEATGGDGGRGCCGDRAGSGGSAEGAGIHSSGQLTINESEFTHNRADAGDAGDYRDESEGNVGGDARGGAVYATWDTQFFQEACLFVFGAEREACVVDLELQAGLEPVLTIDDSSISENRAKGGRGADGYDGRGSETAAGEGGSAFGGAFFIDDRIDRATIRRNEIGQNEAIGGNGGQTRNEGEGGDGGDAKGGAIYNEAAVLRVIDNNLGLNQARGGDGGGTQLGRAGGGGNAAGGAIAVEGDVDTIIRGELELNGEPNFNDLNANTATITSTFLGNQVVGGNGGFKLKTQHGSDDDRAGRGGHANGGAISQLDGTLDIEDIVLTANLASGGAGGNGNVYQDQACGSNSDQVCVGSVGGSNGSGHGGAVFSMADMDVSGSVFTNNTAAGGEASENDTLVAGAGGFDSDGEGRDGGSGGAARGGAIRAELADLRVRDTGFVANNVHAGHGGPGGPALGGSGREVVGGRGGSGGEAVGGAISTFSNSSQQVTIASSLISDQTATAGRGGNGGRGADRVEDEEAFGGRGGAGGNGGGAFGGGVAIEYFQQTISLPTINGNVAITETIVSRNMLAAGDGGFGGTGGTTQGGTLDSVVGGDGGNGGNGGDAAGGGLHSRGVNGTVDRSTFNSNVISSGWGGQGGHGGTSRFNGGFGGHAGNAGDAVGGGIASDVASLQVSHSTIVHNIVLSGFGGNGGFGAPSRLWGGRAGNAGDGGDAMGGGIYNSGDAQDLMVSVTTIGENVVNAARAGFVGVRGPIVGTNDLPERYQPEAGSGLVLSSMAIFTESRADLEPSLQSVFDTGDGGGLPTDVIINDVLSAASVAGVAAGGYATTLIVSGIVSSLFGVVEFSGAVTTFQGSLLAGAAGAAVPALGIVGFVSLVTVGITVSVKIGIGLAQGDSLEDAVRDALGDPGPTSGPNLGILLVGGNNNDDDLPTEVIGPGDPGQSGAQGTASGPGISGATTIDRSIVAGNEARTRRLNRNRVATTECVDLNDRKTVIECDPLTVRIERDLVVFEVSQTLTDNVMDDISGGQKVSDGNNLIGIANSGFQNDLRGTSANPLNPRFASALALNGGVTPTLALRKNSPALDAISIDQPDTAQNDFRWVNRAEIGSWGNPDTDFDGIVDEQESQFGTDPLDPDSDDDMLLDGEEVFGLDLKPNTGDELGIDPLDADTDDDGLVDSREVLGPDGIGGTADDLPSDPILLDTDDDRIQDGTELGESQGHPTDTRRSIFVPDADQGATTTDPRKPDTDDGGLNDGVEDVNANGRVDANELDPRDGGDDRPVYNFTAANYATAELDSPHVSNVVMITRTGGTVVPSSVEVLLIRDVGQELPPTDDDLITVQFPRFATTVSVPIPIMGDTVQEPDEQIFIKFINTPSAEEGDIHPFTDLFVVDDDNPNAPTVESVRVDDGLQTTLVRNLTVTFDRIVAVGDDAFTVTNVDTSEEFAASIALSAQSGKTVAALSFASLNLANDSLPVGGYTLHIDREEVRAGLFPLPLDHVHAFTRTSDSLPAVVSLVVGNDAETSCIDGCQRSMIRKLTVNFNSEVTLNVGGITLMNTSTGQPYVPMLNTTPSGQPTIATLSFDTNSGEGVIAGSLPDGNYSLVVAADLGNATGRSMAADFQASFHRYYGDINGDRWVDVLDSALFRQTYFKSSTDPEFNGDFDLNDDGWVDALDSAELRARYFTELAGPNSPPPNSQRSIDASGLFVVQSALSEQDLADNFFRQLAGVEPLAGDANLDGDVDFSDFLTLSGAFGSEDTTWAHGDFNHDGEVGFADFLLLSRNFGKRR